MELWVSDMAAKGTKHASILSHISAVKHYCLVHDMSIEFATPRLKLILRGIKNSEPRGSYKCRIVSHRELRRMVRLSTKCLGGRAGIRFNAIISLAFFGLLRLGEYCVTRQKHHLLRRNLVLHSDKIELTFETYKHSSSPVKVTLKKYKGIACPIKCMRKYLKVYQQQPKMPLFEVSPSEFRRDFNDIRSFAHISDDITPHALRRGGATWYSDNGWSDAKIRAHGRWASDVFKRYVVSK